MISKKYTSAAAFVMMCLFMIVLSTFPGDSDNYGKIAFVSGRDLDREIYVMDVDGSNIKGLTDNFSSSLFKTDNQTRA